MIGNSPMVMLVDDEPHICGAISRILEREGYEVIATHDGESALRLNQEKKPQVILLDIMMPGMDGREVCRRLRQNSSDTRIIYFTAKVDVDKRKLQNDADGLIAKPAASKQILSVIGSALQEAAAVRC